MRGVNATRQLLVHHHCIQLRQRCRQLGEQGIRHFVGQCIKAAKVDPIFLVIGADGFDVHRRAPLRSLNQHPGGIDPAGSEQPLHLAAKRISADDSKHRHLADPERAEIIDDCPSPTQTGPLLPHGPGRQPRLHRQFGCGFVELPIHIQTEITQNSDPNTRHRGEHGIQ